MKKITIQRFEENDQLNKSSSLHLVILRKEDVASAAAVCDMKGNLVADRIFAIHHAGHGSLQGAFSSYNQLATSPFATSNMSDTCDRVLKKIVWGFTLQYNSITPYFKDCISTHCPMSVVLLLHSLRETFPFLSP